MLIRIAAACCLVVAAWLGSDGGAGVARPPMPGAGVFLPPGAGAAPANALVAAGSTATATVAAPSSGAHPAVSGAPSVVDVPASGPPQSTVSVSGTGFAPGDTLTISYIDAQVGATSAGANGAVLDTTRARDDGTLAATGVSLPASAAPGGIGMLLVRGSGQTVASALFGVTPLNHSLTSATGSVSVGSPVVLSGSGFAPGAAVEVALVDADGQAVGSSGPFTSTTTGAIGPLALTVPITASVGLGTINATDSAGTVAGIPVAIVPAPKAGAGGSDLRIAPARSTLGQTVGVNADGFIPGETVALSLLGAAGSGVGGITCGGTSSATGTPGAGSTPGAPMTPTASGTPGAQPCAATASVPALGTALAADSTGHVQGSFVVPPVDGLTRVVPTGGNGQGGPNQGSLVTVLLRGNQGGVSRRAMLVVTGSRLQVIPRVTVPGHPYTILGEGFAADERVIVTSDDGGGTLTQVGVAQAADDGTLSLSATAPTAKGGQAGSTVVVSGSGQSSGLTASDRLTVTSAPALILRPAVVAPGQGVQVVGSAFSASATVSVQVGALAGGGAFSLPSFQAATDGSGGFSAVFSVPFTVTVSTGGLPVTIAADDGAGNQASAVLTISSQPASLHVTPLSARAGQVLTLRGSGFGSGETVDLFLAVPAAATTALPSSMVPVVADAQGAFTAPYVLPQPFLAGSYLVGAVGETSARQAVFPFVLDQPGVPAPRTPTPPGSVRASPTPTACSGPGASVIYFPRSETSLVPLAAGGAAHAGDRLASWDELAVLNTSDHEQTVTVAYLVYAPQKGGANPVATPVNSRALTFSLAPFGVALRSVADDVGFGRVASIVVRASPSAQEGTGCPVGGSSGMVAARLIAHRALLRTAGKQVQTLGMDGADSSGTESSFQTASAGGLSLHQVFVDGSGAAGVGEYIDLFNPQTTSAQVRFGFTTAYGSVARASALSLPAFATTRVDVGALFRTARARACGVRGTGAGAAADRTAFGCVVRNPDLGMSVVIDASAQIVVERALLWGADKGIPGTGFDLAPGATVPLRSAYFAFGSTHDGDQAALSLLNPAGCTPARCPVAVIEVSLYSATGARVASTKIRLPAGRRGTVSLGKVVDAGVYAVAVRSPLAVYSELGQSFGAGTQAGGHPIFEALGDAGVAAQSGVVTTACPSARACAQTTPRQATGSAGGTLPILRVFNPTGGRVVVRVLAMSRAGVYYVQSFQVASSATLEVAIPPPNTQGAAPAGSTAQSGSAAPAGWRPPAPQTPIGVSVACSGQCAATALVGVRSAGARGSAAAASEVWGGPLR